MYLCSMSHSICSLIIFFGGMNMFFRISTSSVCSAAFVILFLIFRIFTIASWRVGQGKFFLILTTFPPLPLSSASLISTSLTSLLPLPLPSPPTSSPPLHLCSKDNESYEPLPTPFLPFLPFSFLHSPPPSPPLTCVLRTLRAMIPSLSSSFVFSVVS